VSLQSWLSEGLLVAHRTSSREIAELLNMVRQDLSQCRTLGLSPDWSLNIAYSAVLQAASTALASRRATAPRQVKDTTTSFSSLSLTPSASIPARSES